MPNSNKRLIGNNMLIIMCQQQDSWLDCRALALIILEHALFFGIV